MRGNRPVRKFVEDLVRLFDESSTHDQAYRRFRKLCALEGALIALCFNAATLLLWIEATLSLLSTPLHFLESISVGATAVASWNQEDLKLAHRFGPPSRNRTRAGLLFFVSSTIPHRSPTPRRGGNATGFMQFDYGLSAKWLELLKQKWLELLRQMSPTNRRVAVIRDPAASAGIAQFAVIQSVAPAVGIDVVPINVRDASEIERAIENFVRFPNGGVIEASGASVSAHRDLIIGLAARHRLPAIYPRRVFVDRGGLMSYGPNVIVLSQLAAGYVDRILKGAKPADLPVQAPTKYEMVINLKTAKALGLEVPPTLLARADEVIE
jgi:hypothetical protein